MWAQLENCEWGLLPYKIISKSMAFVMLFSIDSIAKLFCLSYEIADFMFVLISFSLEKLLSCEHRLQFEQIYLIGFKLAQFGLVSLFNSISTFMGYLIPKLSLQKNSSGTIWPMTWEENKGVHAFPKSISLKVSVIAWLEFEIIMMSQSRILGNMPQYSSPAPYVKRKSQ